MPRLPSRVAIITGSSSGIGRAIALAFAAEGARILCADLTPTARSEYATDSSPSDTDALIRERGGDAVFVECDTTSAAALSALVDAAVEKYGRLDIMVNNAGISVEGGAAHGPRPIWEYEEEAFDKTLAVNVRGVWLGTKYASRQMVKQEPLESGDRGWILNLASVYGLGASSGISGYVTSKHAVMGLTKAAAWDCAPQRIHVNALCPGYTQSAFIHGVLGDAETKARLDTHHPFRGLGTVEDVAKAAVFLVSEDAGWVTGIGLPVDGGYSSGSAM